jgi:hypothetical protein
MLENERSLRVIEEKLIARNYNKKLLTLSITYFFSAIEKNNYFS